MRRLAYCTIIYSSSPNPIPVKWALHKMGKCGTGIRLPLTVLSNDCQAILAAEPTKTKFTMKNIKYLIVLLLVVFLTGCSSFSGSDDEALGARVINYQGEKGEITDLIIPPDLTSPDSQGDFVISTSNILSDNSTEVQLVKVTNIEVQRDAYRRWLLVGKSPSDVWPLAKKFLKSFGFTINKENEAIGIIETEFLESNPRCSRLVNWRF